MALYPRFDFSGHDVRRAGELIASNLAWNDENAPKLIEAYRIANSWRDSHALPMRSIRYSVIHHIRQQKLEGITGARLKRMPAIRGKLSRIRLHLNQLQDLAGCRAVMADIAAVSALTKILKTSFRHPIVKENDYITKPKPDGYRSYHLIFSFKGTKPEHVPVEGRRVELQVRTQLQHAWATAVEAVGLFVGENLKNHVGSLEWLRLFALVSAEFAETEGCPTPPDVPDREDRLREIRLLEEQLGAISLLDQIRLGVQGTDLPLMQEYRPRHYLIRYDHAAKRVFVEPYRETQIAASSYDRAEMTNRATGEQETVVLVEVDKIENLKRAYPNYFGDVGFFQNQLRLILRGQAAEKYEATPRQPPPRRRVEVSGDPNWLKASRFPKPSLSTKRRSKKKSR